MAKLTAEELVFRKIEEKVKRAIFEYSLIANGDRILIGLSGGKDSLALVDLLGRRSKIYNPRFEVVVAHVVMTNIPYCSDAEYLKSCADEHGLPFIIHETSFDASTDTRKSPCFLCSWTRRKALFDIAKKHNCNKIALGHHMSDVLETTLLGLFYGAQMQTMPPKLRSRNFPGMELIRPLYCVHEDAIIAWKNYNHLRFLQCACRFTEARDAAGDGVGESKRQEMKLLLRELKKTNPNIEKSMFRAIHGVQLDTFPGFKYRGKAHSFLEFYDTSASFLESDET